MNTHDRILATLNLGGPFNDKQRVWRRLSTVATFAEKENDELLEIFAGDLAHLVVLRPSAAGRGIMVALKANVPEEEPDPQVQIMGGNAVNPDPVAEVVEGGLPAGQLGLVNAAPGGFDVHPIAPPPPNGPIPVGPGAPGLVVGLDDPAAPGAVGPLLGGPGIPVPVIDQNPCADMPVAELDVAQCELNMVADVAGFEGIEEGEPNPLGDAAAELVEDAVAEEEELPPA